MRDRVEIIRAIKALVPKPGCGDEESNMKKIASDTLRWVLEQDTPIPIDSTVEVYLSEMN